MTRQRFRFWHRIATLFLGLLIIFWLPVEDINTQPALLIAIPTAILLGLHLFDVMRIRSLPGSAAVGFAGGLSVSPITAAFMLIKIGLHGHGNTPDFSYSDFANIFDRTLFLGAAGLLIGIGIKLFVNTGK